LTIKTGLVRQTGREAAVRILVTGGCGFIGSHLSEALVRAGHQVRVLDNLSSGQQRNLAAVADRVNVRVGDVRDAEVVSEACRGMEAVFHQAALVSVVDSVARPRDNHDINITGTLNVLEAARQHGVRRVIMASSAAIYGNDPALPKQEAMRPAPASPYAIAKLTGSITCRCTASCTACRTSPCATSMSTARARAPPLRIPVSSRSSFKACSRAMAPTVCGDGLQSRDFVYVKDVVQANVAALTCSCAGVEPVFNVASGRVTTLLDLLQVLGELAGRPLVPEFAPARAGDIRHSAADISLAVQASGLWSRLSAAGWPSFAPGICRGPARRRGVVKPALVVMAAGMGSRYGGLKQLDGVGPCGERLLDYSLCDAQRAGFGRIIFIIRRDFAESFKRQVLESVPRSLDCTCVYQEQQDLPEHGPHPAPRVKPWGTGHAIWCARKAVREPFGVINADDFYGREAFELLAGHLRSSRAESTTFGLVGYGVEETLSDHGSVSRGVCRVSPDGWLQGVEEWTGLRREGVVVSGEWNGAAGGFGPGGACFHEHVGLYPCVIFPAGGGAAGLSGSVGRGGDRGVLYSLRGGRHVTKPVSEGARSGHPGPLDGFNLCRG
jgi:UDP-glucose 4-epimerase